MPVLASALIAALRAALLLAAAAAVSLVVAAAGFANGEGGARDGHPAGAFDTGRARGGGARCRHVDVAQELRILRVARVDLHHHVILIDRAVDDRDLTLAECVIERVVDLAGADAEARRGVAIDLKIGFESFQLLVGAHVRDHRVVLKRRDELRRPVVEILHVVRLQRVLVLRVALAAAGPQILHGGEVEASARDLRELRPQPRDHLIHGHVALRQRLERNEHRAGIDLRIAAAAADAGKADDRRHRGVLANNADHLLQLAAHCLKRDALIGLQRADQPSGVLLREKSLGHDDVQFDVQADRSDEDQEHQAAVPQRPGQRAPVAAAHPLEQRRTARLRLYGCAAQEQSAHHRRGRQ